MFSELSSVLEKLEDWQGPFPKLEMADFALKVGFIHESVELLEDFHDDHPAFNSIVQVAAVCKFMGYRANARPNPNLVPIIVAFWTECLEFMQSLVNTCHDVEASQAIVDEIADVLVKRLNWLIKKINPELVDVTIANLDIDDIVKKVG